MKKKLKVQFSIYNIQLIVSTEKYDIFINLCWMINNIYVLYFYCLNKKMKYNKVEISM